MKIQINVTSIECGKKKKHNIYVFLVYSKSIFYAFLKKKNNGPKQLKISYNITFFVYDSLAFKQSS